MRILFAISVIAFVALLWASFSIARYIRRARRRRKLASGAIYKTAHPSASTTTPAQAPAPPPFPLRSQRDADRGSEPSGTVPPPPRPEPANAPARSFSPAAQEPASPGRQDWAYFNKDMGDLSDPMPSRRYKDRSRPR